MPRRRLLLTVSTLVAVALAVTGCTIPTTKDGGGYGPSNQSARKAAKPAPVELHSGATEKMKSVNASWTPALYVATTGTKVVLDVSNTDPTQHNFTFGDLEISKNIPPETSTVIRFTAPRPGRYRFYCKYHQQEMQGWLTVT
ncbi:MAG TPA: cupredoxin domain-containing protein [Actinomycetota bacterium]|jgi:plastocyanin|nr:cupredoxin domain-containing protein [Actinomycetes bacterium]